MLLFDEKYLRDLVSVEIGGRGMGREGKRKREYQIRAGREERRKQGGTPIQKKI